MAGAMLTRWLASGVEASKILVVDPHPRCPSPMLRVSSRIPDEPPPALALLGVKPQKLDEVAPILAPALGPDTILISILAGVEHASLRERFRQAGPIVRAMPNTPAALGKGATSLFAPQPERASGGLEVERLMQALGHVEWIGDEALFDVVAALASSGPAFLFRFIDALASAAAQLGLPEDQAQRLAVATVEGSGALAAAAAESPHRLAEQVASPGGMTRKGLEVLDADDALRRLVHATLEAAVRRSREMGAEARGG